MADKDKSDPVETTSASSVLGSFKGMTSRTQAAFAAMYQSSHSKSKRVPRNSVTSMLGEVGTAMLDASQATNDIEKRLNSLARKYGHEDSQVIVLPTIVMVENLRKHCFFP